MKKATPYIICGLAALFYVYDYFIQVAPSVMTKQLMHSFSIGAGALGILSACFYYAYTIMQIPAGLLLDRFGARRLLTFSVLVSACGVTLFGFSSHLALAGFARFLIGLGSAFAFICALFLVSRWFAHNRFAMIAGFIQLAGSLGSIFGLAPLAIVINHVGWREAMIVTGLITFALSLVYWRFIRDGKSKVPKQNDHAGYKEWHRLKFVLKQKQAWWIASTGLLSWVPVATIGALWGVPFLMKAYGWNNTTAGQLCSLFWVGLALGSPLSGYLSDRIKTRRKPLFVCFALGLVGSILFLMAPNIPAWLAGFSLFILGASASVQSFGFGILKDNIPEPVFGTASGFNNMAALLAGAISQPLVGLLLGLQWNGLKIGGIPSYALRDYRTAFAIVPLAAILGLLVSWRGIKETYCERQYTHKSH